MRVPITVDEMRAAIQEVHLVLPKFGLTSDTMPQVVRLYRESLQEFDRETVDGAGRLLLRTKEKFPTPKVWRDSCVDWLKHNRIAPSEWHGEVTADGLDIVCKVCRSVPQWARLRTNRTPFSAKMTQGLDQTPMPDETFRRIAPCDPDRHRNNEPITPFPPNFIAWAT